MTKPDEELTRPNTLYSPISNLPPEILSLVFQHACPVIDLNQKHGLPDLPPLPPPPKEKMTPLVLSAVSTYWRQVSFSTPHIWTSVDLILDPCTMDIATAVLQAFFNYSLHLPLAIAIEFVPSWGYNTEFLVDASFDAVLHQNTHRIREFHLFSRSGVWIDFLPSLSNLVTLSIECALQETRTMLIKSQCSHLTLKRAKTIPDNIRLCCPAITILHLQDTPIDVCLGLLLACPNLTEYRNRAPLDGTGTRASLRRSFVLPYMETFEWSVSTEDPIDVAMLRHLRMPALRKLVWAEEDAIDWQVTGHRDAFFRNLPSSLNDFHLHDPRVNCEPPIYTFDTVCDLFDVEHLTFSGVGGHFLDLVCHRLSELYIEDNQQMVRLPRLEAITIKEFAPTRYNQEGILEVLERRFLTVDTLSPKPFRIEFSIKVEFLPHFKEKLKEMIGRGLKIEIFEGPKLVDWL